MSSMEMVEQAPAASTMMRLHEEHSLHSQATSSAASSAVDSASAINRKEAEAELAKKETKFVLRLRVLVFLVLLSSMVAVAVLVYLYISRSERAAFEQQFEEDSNKVLQSIGTTLDTTMGGIDALVVSMVSYARATNQTWPYVTIPDFAVRAEKLRRLTKALYMNTYAYVPKEIRPEWEAYSAVAGPEWVQETFAMQEKEGTFSDLVEALNFTYQNVSYWDVIYDYGEFVKPIEEQGTVGLPPEDPGPFLAKWQTSPLIPFPAPYNWDLLSVPLKGSILAVIDTHQVSLTECYLIAYPNDTASIAQNELEADWVGMYLETDEEPMEPVSDIYFPILADSSADKVTSAVHDKGYNAETDNILGGFMSTTIYWRDLIKAILPRGSDGVRVVFSNQCNPTFTYQIRGPKVEFLGVGDFHEPEYEDMGKTSFLLDLARDYANGARSYTGPPVNAERCIHTVRIYPSSVMWQSYGTSNPIMFTLGAVLIFAFTSIVFVIYDWWVERRQRVVYGTALRTHAIVTDLFPSQVRERMYKEQEEQLAESNKKRSSAYGKKSEFLSNSTRSKLGANLSLSQSDSEDAADSKAIADVHPETTVLFSDLAGFTAWSSTRDPPQVFVLLETLYAEFDQIASRRGVFKIETIGDCYVAVTGLPKPRKSHAVVMARFAADAREAMNRLTAGLEDKLGPGTSDLRLRTGLHSGPVTAGVLRGQKSRFQLFGDTVNTAARMESNGKPNRIHCSKWTADQLIAQGKTEWLRKRSDLIEAKGKGKMQTYWIEPRHHSVGALSVQSGTTTSTLGTNGSISTSSGTMMAEWFSDSYALSPHAERLVGWCVGVMQDLLKKLVAHRQSYGQTMTNYGVCVDWSDEGKLAGATVRDEIRDVIPIPDPGMRVKEVDPGSVEVPVLVLGQLRSYITVIAHTYRGNKFHNFDRAQHVIMTMQNLLKRLSASSNGDGSSQLSLPGDITSSFGIALDPLAQVAVMFACLINDVDHPGVPNDVFSSENPSLAALYKGKSVSEQNSVDIAWKLLMEPTYADLQSYLFATKDECERFRQWVVNAVMATDIADPELASDRGKRWDLAFGSSKESASVGVDRDLMDRKATACLELFMQTACACHFVQHWGIYKKWQQLAFEEQYAAYAESRTKEDPTAYWYQTQLDNFDSFVIPLARKLQHCRRILGSACPEFLDNATGNRREWEDKGRAIVREMQDELTQAVEMLEASHRSLLDSLPECAPPDLGLTANDKAEQYDPYQELRRMPLDEADEMRNDQNGSTGADPKSQPAKNTGHEGSETSNAPNQGMEWTELSGYMQIEV